MPAREINLESLGLLASYDIGKFSPAVWKKPDGAYCVRTLEGMSFNRSGSCCRSWGYFDLDKDGIITSCPRGLTKRFKGCKVRDIEAKVEEYKDKRI